MEKVRETVDRLEAITDRAEWPYPDYGTILFSVK
jgi:glutamine synthetase type III